MSHLYVLISFFIPLIAAQDSIIGFQANVYSSKLGDGKSGVILPNTCGENEMLYPGDQSDDWICDCLPGYIYHGDLNKCFEAYRREFCREGQYVALAKDGFSVVCKPNICGIDGRVLLNRTCITLGAPCDINTKLTYGINDVNMQIECGEWITRRIGPDDDDPRPAGTSDTEKDKCVAGSRRRMKSNCKLCTKADKSSCKDAKDTIKT